MNISEILRNSWRLTWRLWQLWVLMLLLFIVFTPAVLLAGGFGGLAGMLLTPWPRPTPAWVAQVQHLPAWAWITLAVVALGMLVVTTALSWMLQAAAMRGAALAMEKGSFTLGEALNLGRQRIVSLLKISVTFGALAATLGIVPPLIIVLLADKFTFGAQLLQTFQAIVGPMNIVLGIALLVVMMSVALEDLTPRRAFRRAWDIFRLGWWGFLLIFGISAAPSFALVFILIPIIFLLVFAFVLAPTVAPLIALLTCACLSPIILIVVLFISVFTLILYTLTYRATAELLGPEAAQPAT
jgi:hypothetical protein